MSIKTRIKQILDKPEPGDRLSLFFDFFILSLILLNILAVILESFKEIKAAIGAELDIFEQVSLWIFVVEYLARVWVSDIGSDKGKIRARISYILSVMAIIDLMAILPMFLPMLIKMDLRALRLFRLFRLFRLLKINRYTKSFMILGNVLRNKKNELVMTLMVAFILLLLSSILIYYAENEAQPEKFKNILASMWWSLATLTTIGYGDVSPVTPLGQVISGFIALIGIGIVALPTGILSSGFIEELGKGKKNTCPHCGKEIE